MTDPDQPPKDVEARSIPEMPLHEALEQAEMENRRIGGFDPQAAFMDGNSTPHALVRLAREVLAQHKTHGCLLSGPGRAHCPNFLGMPDEIKFPDTVDIYGRPLGWCEVCWSGEQFRKLSIEFKELAKSYDQSEKENRVYNLIFAKWRGKAYELARELADWADNERNKEMGKG